MNIALLKLLHRDIRERTSVSASRPLRTSDEKLDFLLYHLGELMIALATDGSQQSINDFYEEEQ